MTLTSEDIQRYVRIAIYWVAGYLTSRGLLSMEGTSVELWAGLGATVANFAWTAWGSRLVMKLNDVAKYTEVKKVIVDSAQMAKDTPSPKVTTKA